MKCDWIFCDTETSHALKVQVYTEKDESPPMERNKGIHLVCYLSWEIREHNLIFFYVVLLRWKEKLQCWGSYESKSIQYQTYKEKKMSRIVRKITYVVKNRI